MYEEQQSKTPVVLGLFIVLLILIILGYLGYMQWGTGQTEDVAQESTADDMVEEESATFDDDMQMMDDLAADDAVPTEADLSLITELGSSDPDVAALDAELDAMFTSYEGDNADLGTFDAESSAQTEDDLSTLSQ